MTDQPKPLTAEERKEIVEVARIVLEICYRVRETNLADAVIRLADQVTALERVLQQKDERLRQRVIDDSEEFERRVKQC